MTENNESIINFFESSYFGMPIRGNVYTFVPLRTQNNEAKVLICSYEKVYCLESSGKPSLVEVLLPSTPSGVEITSIDAFQCDSNRTDYVLGIVYVKGEEVTQNEQSTFKIFTGWEFSSEQKFQNISENSYSAKLNFIPYKLCHTKLDFSSESKTVWLLSGSDCQVHLFHFDEKSLYEDTEINYLFPEFAEVSGIILNMDIEYSYQKRTTVICEENGFFHVYQVGMENLETPKIENSRTLQWDCPVVSVSFFRTSSYYDLPSFLHGDNLRIEAEKRTCSNILVSTSLEGSFVLKDPFGDECLLLPESDNKDVVTCCIVRDIDFDGVNEIIIGTFGQEVLIYKYLSDCTWKLTASVSLPTPVIGIAYEDITGDGICSLIIMTFGGVHIYEHEHFDIIPTLTTRLNQLVPAENV